MIIMVKNYNHYNLNPPEPIAEPMSLDDYWEQAVEEHLYEQNHENPKSHIDLEEIRINELIKNEQSDQTV